MHKAVIRTIWLLMLLATILVPALALPGHADDGGQESSDKSGRSGNDDSGDGPGHDDGAGQDDGSGQSGVNAPVSSEQKNILKAQKDNQAAPLTKLLSFVSKHYPGEILNVALLQKNNEYFYVVKILSPKGAIQRIELKAKTLAKM